MACELLQHVIEEADPRGDIELAGAVEIDRRRDLGLLGVARNRGLPLQRSPRALNLHDRNRAFISLSPAVKGPRPGLAGPPPAARTLVQMQCIHPEASVPTSR